jgi:hypothetical protein
MPITSDLGGKNYTLGRGRLFFNRFTPAQVAAGLTNTSSGEGELFFGNVPEFTLATEEEVLDHFASTGGIRVKDDSVTLQLDRTGSFTTDNISMDNVALLFTAAGTGTVTQSSATAVENVMTVKRGRFYQLGVSPSNPTGVRGVSSVVVSKGAGFTTVVAASGNYEVDEALGRVYILPGSADIPDDTEIEIVFNQAANTRQQVISASQSIYGELHWVSDNPKGAQRDVLMPLVKLSPNGDYPLVGDEWQSMGFSYEILQRGSLAGAYIDGRAL